MTPDRRLVGRVVAVAVLLCRSAVTPTPVTSERGRLPRPNRRTAERRLPSAL